MNQISPIKKKRKRKPTKLQSMAQAVKCSVRKARYVAQKK